MILNVSMKQIRIRIRVAKNQPKSWKISTKINQSETDPKADPNGSGSATLLFLIVILSFAEYVEEIQ